MCRLQFSEPRRGEEASQEPLDEGDEGALEALLALSGDNFMEFEVAEMPAASSFSSVTANQCSRYHCPFPGCKRSFAELWRLKVHYRAPPNIRGSGKERGHGMRLTHCPKCGAALKVGGHHVKCAAVAKESSNNAGSAGRRNRKAAATGPRAEPAQPARAAAACIPVDPALQQLQPGPSTDPAAAAMHSRGEQYLQYGLSEMLQADAGSQHLLWQKALQLQAQHQADELLDEGHTSHMTTSGVVADVTAATGAAQTAGRFLQRVQSSDDSSSSRMVEGSTSGRSGNDNWGPSSSSGSGAGSDGADGQAQQQHNQQQQLLSLFGADRVSAAAAAVQLPVYNLQQPNPAGHQQENPEAGQLLWQHMLLQHLQQHVQQTPGFSLPELIQVAAALFGNKVDTLVSAFGLSGPSRAACEEQEQLARLVAALRQGDCGEPAA